jgi:hypothetical protein
LSLPGSRIAGTLPTIEPHKAELGTLRDTAKASGQMA